MNYLVAHLIGDYILQNDFQAQNKRKSSWVCALHCTLYSGIMFCYTGWPWWVMFLVWVEHFLQDRTPFVAWFMRFNRQERFMQPPLGPWSMIVVDNTFHLTFLFLTSELVRCL
jgi:hypothetical protein